MTARAAFARAVLSVALLSIAGVASAQLAPDAAARRPTPSFAGMTTIGDGRIYYEVFGSGEALVLLHGGGGSSQASWPPEYLRELSRSFKVIVPDSRGHGRSTDGSAPLTFGRLADDVVRLLDHLRIDRAHVVGHSAGAVSALHLLVDFPDRVRTATLLAGLYHRDNYRPEALAGLGEELDAVLRGERADSRFASRPQQVVKKLRGAWLAGPAFSVEQLATIARPTLIVSAGLDTFFAPSVSQRMHAHIAGSELIHYPDATHRVQVTNAGELIPAIRGFIARRSAE